MNHEASEGLLQRAKRVIPGGINSNVRANAEPFPLFYTHGKDARIWDADGNEYIDYALGQGPMLFGHTPAPIVEAIQRQAAMGLVYAGQSELEVRAAEAMTRLVPCAEMVRFNTTGSEAVHAAIRLARAATGRTHVLRFEGHYHGWLDTIAWCPPKRGVELGPPDAPILRPSSLGQTHADGANLLVAPWNDTARVEVIFAEYAPAIAAVICDPFACASGIIPARKDFLELLRRLCDAHGVVLIFDEVITGFRVHLHGAQGLYGVLPDLATFAKALGGGAAVAAVAGKESLMRLFGDLSVVHAGTYNANPLAMAATVAALEWLEADNGAVLRIAEERGKALWEGLAEIAKSRNLPIDFRGAPACFSTTFLPPGSAPVTDFRSSLQCDPRPLDRFWRAMHHRGVQFTAFGIWFLSTAHTETDIAETLEAADVCLAMLEG